MAAKNTKTTGNGNNWDSKSGGKLSIHAFTLLCIEKLRTDRSKGIHVVYSGYNDAFKAYFPGQDPREATTLMAASGQIELTPCKGGVMIYKPGEAPERKSGSNAGSTLKKLGLL